MGWPDKSAKDLQTYYPTSPWSPGSTFIFFWVARMAMMAGHFTDTMPFETVYIHGLVRDENNKKCSKSANNGIDPLVLINKYGTDALRYTPDPGKWPGLGKTFAWSLQPQNRRICLGGSLPQLHQQTVEPRPASFYAQPGWQNSSGVGGIPALENLELADRWILSRYNQVVQTTRSDLDKYGFGEAAKELYGIYLGRLLRLVHRTGQASPVRR